MKILVKCKVCEKEFYTTEYQIKNGRGKCCSRGCRSKSMVKNPRNWKGDKASYRVKHKWIVRHFGKATKCEQCGKVDYRIEWSNKDHKYNRIRSDWQQLCHKCHDKYDIDNKIKERKWGITCGDKNKWTRLKDYMILDIRKYDFNDIENKKRLAIKYKCSYCAINDIIKRRCWKHIK